MTIADALRELKEKPVITLWPTAAMVLDISRSEVYAAAKRGDIEIVTIGRLKKALTVPLRKKLKLESAA
jgi:hypothetical protein